MNFMFLILFAYFLTFGDGSKPCKARKYKETSTVCVCTGAYCDEIDPLGTFTSTQAVVYQTSEAGARMQRSVIKWISHNHHGKQRATSITAKVNPNFRYQEIFGFGGAFTDATGINIKTLSKPAQKKLMEAYFSTKGIEYNVGRIPIASCDFSTHEYSYDDHKGDIHLVNFSLTVEDIEYKIPFIKQAQQLSNNKVRLFGSPWSPPGWMKTSGVMHGNGTIIGQPGGSFYKAYAQYLLKFLEAYKKLNVTIWGLTPQNEPAAGFVPAYKFQACGFTAEMERDFIKRDLGPALAAAGYGHLKLMIMDDQRPQILDWAKEILKDREASKYISGIAVHWYGDAAPPVLLSKTHHLFPEHFILATEACTGNGPSLGNWARAEQYAHDIIQDLNHYVVGWTDWNLALDPIGGPNWVQNYVDSPIIINKTADEFYKQPMFYALGHFSKFLPPGSVRIGLQLNHKNLPIDAIAFRTPNHHRVMIITNRAAQSVDLTITESQRTDRLKLILSPRSIMTVIWKKPKQ